MDSTANGICKTCNTGYILPYGGHEVCEGCLGHGHAVLALSPPCLCRHYAALPRQRGADTAAAIAERADDFTVPLDDALSLLVSSESDDSDRDEEGALPRLPLSERRGPGQQHCPSLPPPHFQWLELWWQSYRAAEPGRRSPGGSVPLIVYFLCQSRVLQLCY